MTKNPVKVPSTFTIEEYRRHAVLPEPEVQTPPPIEVVPVTVDDEDLDLYAEAPGDWIHAAVCEGEDPALFFPERGESTAPAKAICKSCPVRQECLEYALRTSQRFGIWGGRSERERHRMRFGINGGRAA